MPRGEDATPPTLWIAAQAGGVLVVLVMPGDEPPAVLCYGKKPARHD